MSGFLTDLATGFAVLLAVDDALGLTWRPNGSMYTADELGVTVMAVPPSPDGLVTVSPYPLSDDATFADSDIGLQIRSRAAGEDPRTVLDLDDAIADALLGRWPLTLSTGIRVVTLERSSSASFGQDAAKRWSRSSNYLLRLHRPGTHRL